MAVQIKVDELQGCETYLKWLMSKSGIKNCELCKRLFETDFAWSVDADEIRAKDAVELRRIYSDEVGLSEGKSVREIDRIWKSIGGKCSVFELLLKLAMQLDSLVNEEEEGSRISYFMEVFMRNLGLDFSVSCVADNENREDREEDFREKIDRFIERKYGRDGSGGGLFPLKKTSKDQRKEPIWNQMNEWLNEHLDEDCCFIW